MKINKLVIWTCKLQFGQPVFEVPYESILHYQHYIVSVAN